jgi:hypothetical protein
MQRIDGIPDDKLYQIKSFIVDNRDETETAKAIVKPCEITDVHNYNVGFYWEYKHSLAETVNIETVIETITPITDIHCTHRVSAPCKRYSNTITLFNNNYSLSSYGFGFMDQTKFTKHNLENGVIMKFNDWILPGDGIIFAVQKKCDNFNNIGYNNNENDIMHNNVTNDISEKEVI